MHLKVLSLQETEYCNKQDDKDRKKPINMAKPHRFTLSGNNTTHILALILTGLEHRKIETSTKHYPTEDKSIKLGQRR